MGSHRLRVIVAAYWTSLLLVVSAHAEIREFGWYGTVGSIDPAFAGALPIDANIAVDSPAFVRFEFETTTPDQDPTPNGGDYAGALASFTIRIGSFSFTTRVGGPANSIVILADSLFQFYESQTSVDPSSPIPTYPDLGGDVLVEPITAGQIPNDDLLLTVPDPDAWSTASSGVLGPTGTVLLDIDLVAVCVGSCQPVPEPASAFMMASGVLMLVGLAPIRRSSATGPIWARPCPRRFVPADRDPARRSRR